MARVLRVRQLQEACGRLFNEIESQYGAEVDLDAIPVLLAEYWSFDLEDAYTCADDPTRLAGDFREDMDEVEEVLTRPEGEIFLWHDLNHLAGVLRGIAFMDHEDTRH